jgi:putative ABC transport system permease protein
MPSVLAHAWQSWKNAKAVFVLAALALAIGIGSTTAIYTVINTVMLKPLTYREGERYAALFTANVATPEARGSMMVADLLAYRHAQSFELFGWYKPRTFNLTAPGPPQHVDGIAVTTTLAHGLGVSPLVGRWFQNESEAVISQALWRRLGGANDILDKPLVLSGQTFTITGVMPPRFRFPEVSHAGANARSDVWIGLDPDGKGQDPRDGFNFGYVKLKPGVTFSQAEAEIKAVAASIAQRDPNLHPNYTAALDPLRTLVVKGIRPTLLLLLGSAALLLLITCGNVAGLLLTRAVERARETAVRVALGATPRQLAVQYFVEGLVVSLIGAAAGVLLSIVLVRTVVSVAAEFIPRADEVGLDWSVLLFAVAIACLSSALSSLAPLWQAIRTQPNAVLTEGVRGTAGARSRQLSRSLVIGEMALAFTLLSVSAALLAHLHGLTRVWPGFDHRNLLTFQLALSDTIATKTESRVPQQRRLLETIQAIPGVTDAAFVNQTPLDGCCLSTVLYPDGRPTGQTLPEKTAFLPISPGFFQTLRIPLNAGRLLSEHDANDEDLLIVVVNDAAGRHYWPTRNPLGGRGRISSPEGSPFEVVGVVGDIRNDGIDKPTVPEVYMLASVVAVNPMHFVVRSQLPASTLIPEVRRAIQRVDPMQPIHNVATMEEIVHTSVTLERLGSFMTGFFALAALVMATLGIYGVVSYSVRQRTVEIGTRMALGALARDLLLLVVGGGLRMAAYGLAIGAVAVAAAVWALIRAFSIHDLGWLPFASSTAVVAAVAGAASFFPAWRATLLSPMVAIRNEPRSMWESARRGLRSAVRGIAGSISDGEAAFDSALLAEFVDAARLAASHREAVNTALQTLCARIGATSAMLLEKITEREYRCAAATSDSLLACSLPAEGFVLHRLRHFSLPLPIANGDLETLQRWSGSDQPERLSELETLKHAGARLAIGLRSKTEITGVLLLGAPAQRGQYSAAEKDLLRHCAEQFALMLENARLTDRIVEQEKLRRDLALAAEVQKRLLPDRAPQAEIAAVAAVSLPARSVGGDYYDFLDVGDHRIGIALADVSGKGVAAALIMSVVHASLRIISSEGDISLPQLACRMNSFLHRSTGSKSYATFFYAQIDERRRQLRYVNAGHNPPYLVRPLDARGDGGMEIQELSTGGTVLGLFPQMSYEEATIDLRSGDVLVMFTDGVTEALNPNDEEFGNDRLRALVRDVARLPVQDIASRVTSELKQWIDTAAQHDDLTFVVMKVN